MKNRLPAIGIFIAWCAFLVKVMVFKHVPVIKTRSLMINFGGTHGGPPNLVPFKTILPYLLGEKGWMIAGINLAGNIVLLVPMGLLAPFIFRNMTWKNSLALGVAAGFTIEGMQALLHVGIFDIDDIILNSLGVMIGYWMCTILQKMLRRVKSKNIIILAVIVFLIAVAASLYSVAVYQQRQQPLDFIPDVQTNQPDSVEKGETSVPRGEDPCHGTGGTGQVVGVGNNSITIKRHDNTTVVINFTTRTAIRNAAGAVSKADVKIGDRVTVVVDFNSAGTGTATTVLICNESGPGAR